MSGCAHRVALATRTQRAPEITGTNEGPAVASQRRTDTSSITGSVGLGPGFVSTTIVASANSSITSSVTRNSTRNDRGASRQIHLRY
jgi:hypothetical protein